MQISRRQAAAAGDIRKGKAHRETVACEQQKRVDSMSNEKKPKKVKYKYLKEENTKLGRKTTIRARIIRLSFISVFVSTVALTAFNLVNMYREVSRNATGQIELMTMAYSTAISNADMNRSNVFMKELFTDFSDNNPYDGFGFAVTMHGGVFSETGSEIIKNGDNIITLAESDSGYAELAQVINAFTDTESQTQMVMDGTLRRNQQIITLKGRKYYMGWAVIKSFDTCYTMILLPYDNVMREFRTAVIMAVVIAAVLLTASIIVSLQVAKRITKPITDATQRLRALSKGDLASPSPVTYRNDETLVLLTSLSDTIKAMTAYISDIKNVLQGVAEGNLLVKSDAVYSGDFYMIKQSLDQILSSLNGAFGQVNRAASSVKACSANVSDGTSVLSKNSAAEAVTIRELTASVASVNEKINRSAEEASRARELTRSADACAVDGKNSMHRMIEAIGEIETSANEIEKIINVIDDIAFQTNILALNAAVEAARAGTAGKGFAVVADEVRNLAVKSAEAASQTNVLIENSVRSVRSGTALANETAGNMDKMIEVVDKVTQIVDNIAVSAKDQAQTVHEINRGMEMINESIQGNSAAADKNAEYSEELSSQFEKLDRMINKFRFNG